MLFPKSRMRFTTNYQGKSEPGGWIVLDIAGLELDGVNKIYLPVADIDQRKQGGDIAAERLKQAKSLLGGESEEAEES